MYIQPYGLVHLANLQNPLIFSFSFFELDSGFLSFGLSVAAHMCVHSNCLIFHFKEGARGQGHFLSLYLNAVAFFDLFRVGLETYSL